MLPSPEREQLWVCGPRKTGKEGRELCWDWVFLVPLPMAVDLPGDLLGSWWEVREILGMVCRNQISSSSRRLNSMVVVGRRVMLCWCQYHDRAKWGFLSFCFASVKGTPKETSIIHPCWVIGIGMIQDLWHLYYKEFFVCIANNSLPDHH